MRKLRPKLRPRRIWTAWTQKCYVVADQQSSPQWGNGQTAYWIVRLENVELLFLHGPAMLDRHLFSGCGLSPRGGAMHVTKRLALATCNAICIWLLLIAPYDSCGHNKRKKNWSLEGTTLKVHLLPVQSLRACYVLVPIAGFKKNCWFQWAMVVAGVLLEFTPRPMLRTQNWTRTDQAVVLEMRRLKPGSPERWPMDAFLPKLWWLEGWLTGHHTLLMTRKQILLGFHCCLPSRLCNPPSHLHSPLVPRLSRVCSACWTELHITCHGMYQCGLLFLRWILFNVLGKELLELCKRYWLLNASNLPRRKWWLWQRCWQQDWSRAWWSCHTSWCIGCHLRCWGCISCWLLGHWRGWTLGRLVKGWCRDRCWWSRSHRWCLACLAKRLVRCLRRHRKHRWCHWSWCGQAGHARWCRRRGWCTCRCRCARTRRPRLSILEILWNWAWSPRQEPRPCWRKLNQPLHVTAQWKLREAGCASSLSSDCGYAGHSWEQSMEVCSTPSTSHMSPASMSWIHSSQSGECGSHNWWPRLRLLHRLGYALAGGKGSVKRLVELRREFPVIRIWPISVRPLLADRCKSMLELMLVHDPGPESWNLDILNGIEVRLGDRRLELLQVSCHILPKLPWTISHKPCHFAILGVDNYIVWGILTVRTCPEGRECWFRGPGRRCCRRLVAWILQHLWSDEPHNAILWVKRIAVLNIAHSLNKIGDWWLDVGVMLIEQVWTHLKAEVPHIPISHAETLRIILHGQERISGCLPTDWNCTPILQMMRSWVGLIDPPCLNQHLLVIRCIACSGGTTGCCCGGTSEDWEGCCDCTGGWLDAKRGDASPDLSAHTRSARALAAVSSSSGAVWLELCQDPSLATWIPQLYAYHRAESVWAIDWDQLALAFHRCWESVETLKAMPATPAKLTLNSKA